MHRKQTKYILSLFAHITEMKLPSSKFWVTTDKLTLVVLGQAIQYLPLLKALGLGCRGRLSKNRTGRLRQVGQRADAALGEERAPSSTPRCVQSQPGLQQVYSHEHDITECLTAPVLHSQTRRWNPSLPWGITGSTQTQQGNHTDSFWEEKCRA